VVPAFDDRQSLPLVAALIALGAIPAVAATAPAMLLRGLDEGRRDDVTPSLVVSALGGGLGILAAIGLTSVVDVDDARLSHLMPYFSGAMVRVGVLVELGHHRIGGGCPGTFAAVAAGAGGPGGGLRVGPAQG